MKNLLFLLTILIMAAAAWSQTNELSQTNTAAQTTAVQTNATAPTDAQPKNSAGKEIDIKSKLFSFTENPSQIVYYDHVVITNIQLILTCERFTINLPPGDSGGHPTNAVAETNLDIIYVDKKGQKYHLTADKGIYDYSVINGVTNETCKFTGHVTNRTEKGWMTAEPLIYNLVSGDISGEDIETHGNLPASNGTNGSPFNFGR